VRRTCLIAAVLASALLYGAETPIPPAPTRWVTDTANFLSPETVQTLDSRLQAYEQRTGHQMIVYVAPTTGGVPIEDWAVRAFQKWKVGRKGLDDGLAVFIMSQDRRIRIEVGYGLEPVVPDAIASRVINEVMVPAIQAGKPDHAVTAAVDALTATIDKQAGAMQPGALPPAATPEPSRTTSGLESIFWGVVGVLFLGLMITHPRLALLFLTVIFSGGRGYGGGGYSYGGGGFGGGGGRSGGGGACGSW
jgi:uncharacterized protein